MSALLIERAPAKINLALHVLGRYPNGWHELESLVAFSGAGDLLTLTPGDALMLYVDGPSAGQAGPDSDNLVLRAARNLLRRAPGLRVGSFQLTKRLPAAAGLGGGSSDAAAALRLLARANALNLDDERIVEAARESGADVPVCLHARARVMAGIGERLGPVLSLPPLFCVLANPGAALETSLVFSRMGLAPGDRSSRAPGLDPGERTSSKDLIDRLATMGNDMEDAARALSPAVSETLAALGAVLGARLVRMSGSGATCFAIFHSCREASAAAKRLRSAYPSWWVKATTLR